MHPFGFFIDVISHCNLRCPSCLIGNKFGNHEEWPRGLMSADTLGRILDKAQKECDVAWVALYNWTEPLLHPDIVELIRVVRSRNLPLSLSSNLNVLRDADTMLKAGPNFFRISLSGFTQRVYERGHREGDIEIVKSNMRELARAKERVGASTHIDVFYHRYRYNLHEVEPMRAFAADLGFAFIPFAAQIFPVEKIIAIARGEGTEEDRHLTDNFVYSLEKTLAASAAKASRSCTLLDDQIAIDVNGNVNLCCSSSLDRANAVGSFLDLPLVELQRRRNEHALCRSCGALGIPDYLTSSIAGDL